LHLTERHIITNQHPWFKELDHATFLSKNLYNRANYVVREEFIKTSKEKEEGKREQANWMRTHELNRMLLTDENYIALPRKVSQHVLMQVDSAWKSFFASMRSWKKSPSKFKAKPEPPRFKHKQKGRAVLVYSNQAISKMALKKRKAIELSGVDGLSIPYQHIGCSPIEARIVPCFRTGRIIIEVVYEKQPIHHDHIGKNLHLAIDLGVNNLMALTSDKPGFIPALVNGRPLKSINQFYNKRRAKLQSMLPEGQKTSKRLRRLFAKRSNKLHHEMHHASKLVIDICLKHGIGSIIIGKNDGWKQGVNIGKRNNQNFVSIPFDKLLSQIEYKAALQGIDVKVREEAYTSKCSFLDQEPIRKHETYAGRRVKRGLFRADDGRLINADINGSYNILRKEVPAAFAKGIEAVVVRPKCV
jgi:IS605 OrfB family transposase